MDNANIFGDEGFSEETELTAQTVDWGKINDQITGTFIKARHGVETQFGQNSIYEILSEKGEFHKLTKKVPAEKPTIIHKDEVWSVWGRNEIFNSQLNSLKPGQVVKLIYTEDVDTKMGTMKMIKIRAPRNNDGTVVMNQTWLDQNVGLAGF